MTEFQNPNTSASEKAGANFIDQNRIKKLAVEGADAGFISAKLSIKLSTVKAFMPKIDRPADDLSDIIDTPEPKPKPRRKPAAKKTG